MWADPIAVRIEGTLIGVRSDDAAVMRALAEVLAPYAVDGPASPNLSLRRGEGRELHVLFWGGCSVIRSRDPARAVSGLLGHLGGHRRPPTGVARLRGHAFIGPDGAATVLVGHSTQVPRIERRMRERGWMVVDRPWIDVADGRLVVGAPLEADEAVVAGLVAAMGGSASDPGVPPGSYPVERLAIAPGSADLDIRSVTVALVVASAQYSPEVDLVGLGRLARQADHVEIDLRPRSLGAVIDRLVGPVNLK